jgi:hypothetical protein
MRSQRRTSADSRSKEKYRGKRTLGNSKKYRSRGGGRDAPLAVSYPGQLVEPKPRSTDGTCRWSGRWMLGPMNVPRPRGYFREYQEGSKADHVRSNTLRLVQLGYVVPPRGEKKEPWIESTR